MSIDVKDIITLDDDNRYMVISKVKHKENMYFYLINVEDRTQYKFLYQTSEKELSEFNDPKIMEELLPLFCKEIYKHLDISKLKELL